MRLFSSCRQLAGNWRMIISALALTAALTLFLYAPASIAVESDPSEGQSSTEIGSGSQYKTVIERNTEGELSPDDLHQVSLLTSRIVGHLNEATQNLADMNKDSAGDQIDKAEQLIKVVRDILPVTTVVTTVTDAAGKKIYHDSDTIQKDRIPLYRGAVSLEIVEPLLDAKQDEADIKGLRLAEVEVIHTSLTADLRYIERKLALAKKLLDEPEKALAQLVLAQTQGMKFSVNENDHPLVDAQAALRLSERMVKEKRFEAARENLRLAQIRLESYRAVIDEEPEGKVKALQDEMATLISQIEEEGAAGKIRKYWERVVSWFHKEPGEAESTSADAQEKEKHKDS